MTEPETADRLPAEPDASLLTEIRRDRARQDRRLETIVLSLVALATAAIGYLALEGPALTGVGPVPLRVSAGLFAAAVLAGLLHVLTSRRLQTVRSAAHWAVRFRSLMRRKSKGEQFRLPEDADEDELLERLRDDFELDLDELPLQKQPDQLRTLYRELAQQRVQAERARVRELADAFADGVADDAESPLESSGEEAGFGRRRRRLERWRRLAYRGTVLSYLGGVLVLVGSYLVG